MNDIIELTRETFGAEVLQANGPVVVDFYAPWCGPCKMLAPLLEQLAGEYQGRIKFVKLNVDNAPEQAGAYGVNGVPTLGLFRGGQFVDALVGLVPARSLKAWLEAATVGAAQAPAAS